MKVIKLFMPLLIFLIFSTPACTQTGRFYVNNGKIWDPNGNLFVIKGVTAVYGAFGGGDVNNYGIYDYDDQYHTYQEDLSEIAKLGGNLIRLMVSVPGTNYYNSYYASYYSSEENYKAEIHKVVGWIREQGMIAFIIPFHPNYDQTTIDFLVYLAQTYKNDPYIWIGTSNEPDRCASTACWENWHEWHNQYVATIRAQGYQDPIVVNGVYWSGRLDRIHESPLHDHLGNVDTNLIYGAHLYGNDYQTFNDEQRAYSEQYWASLVEDSPYAIMIDEFGNYNGGKGYIEWMYGFMDYVTDWTLNRGGDGAIAFTWRWSDGNKMVDWQSFALTEWGNIFNNQYLKKVDGNGPNPIPTYTPTPTTPQPLVLGDANLDGKVDMADFVIWINNYIQSRYGYQFR
jgi:hypothetical protein